MANDIIRMIINKLQQIQWKKKINMNCNSSLTYVLFRTWADYSLDRVTRKVACVNFSYVI